LTESDIGANEPLGLCINCCDPQNFQDALHFLFFLAFALQGVEGGVYKVNAIAMTPQTSGLEPPAPKMDANSKMVPVTRSQKASEPLREAKKTWNTKNLGLRLASDFIAGASAATLVAPLITVIDKSVSSLARFIPGLPLTPYTEE
jgi:hypothetical protein